MMASLDTRRPAAQQQLKVLGEQTGVPTLPIVPLEMPLAITRRALETAKREGFDVLILDTAGRLSIDEELMKEVADISDLSKPKETLLVKVWGYDTDAGDNNVEAYISFLRKKLALLRSRVTLTVVRRLGYRWNLAIPAGDPEGMAQTVAELEAAHPMIYFPEVNA